MEKMNLQEEETEYISIPKSIALQIKEAKSDKAVVDLVAEYIQQYRKNLQTELDYLDDAVVQFKANAIKAKTTFEKLKDTEFDALYDIWQNYDKDISKIREKVANIKNELYLLKAELKEIKDLMQSIKEWDAERFIGLAEKASWLMNGETGNMMKFLFENYKK